MNIHEIIVGIHALIQPFFSWGGGGHFKEGLRILQGVLGWICAWNTCKKVAFLYVKGVGYIICRHSIARRGGHECGG